MSSTPAAAGRWKRHSPDPLLALRPGKFDSEHLHAPMVVKESGRYRMWYSGSDRERNEYHRIAYAESPDGLLWLRALRYLATRPAEAPQLLRLRSQSRVARASLAGFLSALSPTSVGQSG